MRSRFRNGLRLRSLPQVDKKFLGVDTPAWKIKKSVHHSITLPEPSSIRMEAYAQLTEGDFENNPNSSASTTGDHLASVVVFVYDSVHELEQIRFQKSGLSGVDKLEDFALGGQSYVNLHFWADSDKPEPTAEAAANAEAVYVKMLNADRYPVGFPEDRRTRGVEGVAKGEYMSLPERHKRFRSLLNKWRTPNAQKLRYRGADLLRPSSRGTISRTATCGSLMAGSR